VGLDPGNVRRSYDTVADRYADELLDELTYKPLDRALLSVVADDVAARGAGPIGDLGAGPGHVAAFLSRLPGLGVASVSSMSPVALDLSPAMAAIARHRLGVPSLAGSLSSLPVATGALGGAVAFYCLIHLDDQGLVAAAAELARVIVPGGPLLVAFHSGDEVRHLDDWWDQPVDLDFRFLTAARVVPLLEGAGFTIEATLTRAPYEAEHPTTRTYLLARRPGP
jgi:SAM-dependent methyltransferase